jgi:hypothetical protein
VEYRDQDFEGKVVMLDGNTFTGCTFRNCKIVFGASASVMIGPNHFKENVDWTFVGAAAATLEFLSQFYNSTSEGGRELIERTFEQIRRGGLEQDTSL